MKTRYTWQQPHKKLKNLLSGIDKRLEEAYERASAEKEEAKEKNIEAPKNIYVDPETGKLVRYGNL